MEYKKYFWICIFLLILCAFPALRVGAAIFKSHSVGVQIGNESISVSEGENLLYGVIKESSSGNLILLQNSAGTDTFKVDVLGNLTVSGRVKGVSTPVSDSDAATKSYVDAAVAAAGSSGSQVFTSSGTWTRPEGVYEVNVIVIGGGGGGGSGGEWYGGGGGGSGSVVIAKGVSVTKDYYGVTVGEGGARGTNYGYNATDGENGGTSAFDTGYIIAEGGSGGTRGTRYLSGEGGSGGSLPGFSLFNTIVFAGASGGNMSLNGQKISTEYKDAGEAGASLWGLGFEGGGGAGGWGEAFVPAEDGGEGLSATADKYGEGGEGAGAGGGAGGGCGCSTCDCEIGDHGGRGADGIVIIYW